MRLLTSIIAILILTSCGPDRKTPIEDRGGQGPDTSDPRQKLQASLNDSKLMTSMVMSRFGEVDRLIRALVNFKQPTGNCPFLELGAANDGKVEFQVDWTACSGTFLVYSEQVGEINLDDHGKFLSAKIWLREGSASVYRHVGQGTYDIKAHSVQMKPTNEDGVYSFTSRFQIERRLTQNKKKWAVNSRQAINGQVLVSAENSNPDRPNRTFVYSDVHMKSDLEQSTLENDRKIYILSSFDFVDEPKSVNSCGFLEGAFSVWFKSDRLENEIKPEKKLIVGSASLTDPFGAVYRYDNCLDKKNNLMFVKTNLESLMRYKVRD